MLFLLIVMGLVLSVPQGMHAEEIDEFDEDESAIVAGAVAQKPTARSYVLRAWPSVRETLHQWIDGAPNAVDGSLIYNLQIQIASLLDYAIDASDKTLLYDIEHLYARTLDPRFLSQKTEYKFWNGYDAEGKYQYAIVPTRQYFAWLGSQETESILGSSQFMYAVTRLTASLSQDDAVVARYSPIIEDFYSRMVLGLEPGTDNGVFQHRGYSCIVDRWDPVERFNHKTYVKYLSEKKYKGTVSYCNAIDDTDLWVMAGTLEMLALERKRPTSFHITDEERRALQQYVSDAAKILKGRFAASAVKFGKKKYASLVFDPGTWSDHPDYAYSGFQGREFPDPSMIQHYPVPRRIAWDVSHSRRLVQVMETFYRHLPITGGVFPKVIDMRHIANQAAFGTFRGTMQKPQFTNFLDGSNGWYRVNYSGRAGFGYYPFAQSSSFPGGGYCRFAKYNADIRKICSAIFTLTITKAPALIEHRRNTFEYCYMNNFEKQRCDSFDYKDNSVSLLNFFASLL